jgi:hypothetical protein
MKKTSIPPLTTVMNEAGVNGSEHFIGPPQDQVPEHKEPLLPPIASSAIKMFGKQEPTYALKLRSIPSSVRSNKFQYRHQSHSSR